MGRQIIGRFLSLLHRFKFWIFYHVSEYVAEAAEAIYPGKKMQNERKAWLRSTLHELKKHPLVRQNVYGWN